MIALGWVLVTGLLLAQDGAATGDEAQAPPPPPAQRLWRFMDAHTGDTGITWGGRWGEPLGGAGWRFGSGQFISSPHDVENLFEHITLMLGPSIFPEILVRLDADGKQSYYYRGQALDAERVQREEGRVTLLDANGETLRSFELTADGRLIMPRGSMLAVLPTPPSRPGRPSIGVTMAPVDPALAAQLGQRAEDVVLVTQVGDGTPAATAGIQRYDVIQSINGQSPVSPRQLRDALRAAGEGGTVRLGLLRAGQSISVECKVVLTETSAYRRFGATPFRSGLHAPPVWEFHEGLRAGGGSLHLDEEFAKLLRDIGDAQLGDAQLGDAQLGGVPLPPAIERQLEQIEQQLKRLQEIIEQRSED